MLASRSELRQIILHAPLLYNIEVDNNPPEDKKKRFEVTDHTADIGITAYGGSLDELMANAAAGMVSLVVDPSTVGDDVIKTIELQDSDSVALLVKWLNELLYEFEVGHVLFSAFNVFVGPQNRLTAICSGENYDPARHRITREVKAATYHNLNIEKGKDGYRASIIFDI
jgi:SHS2 domain-containing protein